jgi:hypothetical protein
LPILNKIKIFEKEKILIKRLPVSRNSKGIAEEG